MTLGVPAMWSLCRLYDPPLQGPRSSRAPPSKGRPCAVLYPQSLGRFAWQSTLGQVIPGSVPTFHAPATFASTHLRNTYSAHTLFQEVRPCSNSSQTAVVA